MKKKFLFISFAVVMVTTICAQTTKSVSKINPFKGNRINLLENMGVGIKL